MTPWVSFNLKDFVADRELSCRFLYKWLVENLDPEKDDENLQLGEDAWVKETLEEFEKDDGDPWISEFDAISGPILEGLVFAFENGIIHRDLKPDNIFLSWYLYRLRMRKKSPKFGLYLLSLILEPPRTGIWRVRKRLPWWP